MIGYCIYILLVTSISGTTTLQESVHVRKIIDNTVSVCER